MKARRGIMYITRVNNQVVKRQQLLQVIFHGLISCQYTS